MTKRPHHEKLDKERGQSGLFRSERPYELTEFDRDCLLLLPDEGAKLGRYMRDAMTVRQIKQKLDPTLTSGYVSMRMRTMLDAGLVVKFDGASGSAQWQRTKAGRDLIAPRAAS